MNLHEYQAKRLLAQNGVAVPPGEACTTVEAARAAAERLSAAGHTQLVVKAQIHAGGRGKGVFTNGFKGGVKLCRTAAEVSEHATAMLGNTLVTKQTGPDGRRVGTVFVASAPDIDREFYCAVLLDRGSGRPLVMASSEGGVDIEEVASRTPERIVRELIDPSLGMMPYQARRVAAAIGFESALIPEAAKLIGNVFQTWWRCDASLVEINPLATIRRPDGTVGVAAVDAKMSVDDNALYRHPEIKEMRDLGEEAPLEVEASRHDLNYIKLDGSIACLVNGAGLAMATMDIIQHFGGLPANFLDVGGGASKEQVTAAFRIILSDANVKAILVNIFGGIMQCDTIAAGIVTAAKETNLQLPLVVRLEGNNVELGRKILQDSGLPILNAGSMADAAKLVVETTHR